MFLEEVLGKTTPLREAPGDDADPGVPAQEPLPAPGEGGGDGAAGAEGGDEPGAQEGPGEAAGGDGAPGEADPEPGMDDGSFGDPGAPAGPGAAAPSPPPPPAGAGAGSPGARRAALARRFAALSRDIADIARAVEQVDATGLTPQVARVYGLMVQRARELEQGVEDLVAQKFATTSYVQLLALYSGYFQSAELLGRMLAELGRAVEPPSSPGEKT